MAVRTAPSREAGRVPLPLGSRTDNWWIKPALTVLALGGFTIYALWRAFENQYFLVEPYLTPLYAPYIPTGWSIFGWVISPAFYILIFPLVFRITCYYYRLAYYRAFFLDPPACAVTEPAARKGYTGERRFPLVLQNLHRYALYAAIVFVFILSYDAILAFFFEDGFHVHIGSVIMVVNVVFIALYTFSCHSLRHLVGGGLNCYSCSRVNQARHGLWQQVSNLNTRHSFWAWISLFTMVATDFYIRSLAAGMIQDFRIF
jgi:hypothetical protein